MDRPIEVNAERGTQQLIAEAGQMLQEALIRRGPQSVITCLNTVYYLPIALGLLARPVQKLGDLQAIMEQAIGTPDPGRAALLAAEVVEALRADDGDFASPISDLQVHSWGVQLADGRMPGIALMLGHAASAEAARQVVRELHDRNILCLLGSDVEDQLKDSALEFTGSPHVVALGRHPSSAVHGIGVAPRCAMKLGGHKPGSAAEILDYCRRRMPGLVLALGGLGEQDYALARGAEEFGFPLIESQGGAEKPGDLVDRCIAVRGLKPRAYDVHAPVKYGPAFEDETVPDEDLHIQYGGADCATFILLEVAVHDELRDGEVEIIGPALPNRPRRGGTPLGILVKVAGAKLQSDFEPYLERQIQAYLNYASGVRCSGPQDRMSLRISKAAAASGLGLESLGRIVHARLRGEFPAVEKVEVTLITQPEIHVQWLGRARAAHAAREEWLAGMTDDQVDVFFACTNCRPFAPRNVSIISPERVSPCGQCTWLDAKASYELNAGGARRPISLGKPIDREKGIWEGTNQYARTASQGRIQQVSLYSIMQAPMAACADFECMVVLIPEANGVMVLGREDTMMATPAGLTVETFASVAAGEQIPGIVGMGRRHLLSRKFIAPEGGFKRVVWMSSTLKDSLAAELRSVCAREGEPDLLDKIADERSVTTVDALLSWLKSHEHPVLRMTKMF